jgi:hypothetical protein
MDKPEQEIESEIRTRRVTPLGGRHMRTSLPILIALCLIGCEQFEHPDRPWHGYAWRPRDNQFAWLPLEEQEEYNDCMKKAYEVSHSEIYKYLYSEPVGCAYFGGTYWHVWSMNMMGRRKQHFGCIARITNKDEIDAGRRYRPELSKKTRGEDWYCV